MDLTPELEPRIWSHITDELPEGHPLAQEAVACIVCRKLVHADYNECMATWVETGRGPYCFGCFAEAIKDVQPPRNYVAPNGREMTIAEETYYLMSEGEGWGLTSETLREATTQSGGE
ncbi:MAG: hypothetical protein JWO67_2562 [Streptosporangiaceae bacterium]|nr:hypothetical protein [Streptosporangiaceae bacterium]